MENRRRIAVSLLSGAWGATPERELRYHGPQFRALRDVAGAILRGGLRQAWEDAEATSSRNQDLFDLAPIGYLRLDRQGMILQVNQAARTMLAAFAACPEGPFESWLDEIDQIPFRAFLDRVFTTQGKQIFAGRVVRLHGQRLFVNLHATAGRKTAHECYLAMVEAAVTPESWWSALDDASISVLTKDPEGRVNGFNRCAERLYGFSGPTQMGKTLAMHFPPEIAAPILENDRQVMELGLPTHVEEVLRYGDDDHWCISSRFPIRDAGQLKGLCILSVPLSEVAWAKEGLTRAFTEMEQMLGTRT